MKESVERKIASIAARVQGATYLFENWASANVRLDKMPLPAIINLLPVSGRFNIGSVMLKDCPNCLIAFADKTQFDYDGQQNDEVIERCKKLAIEFIKEANKSGLFEWIEGDVNYSVFYDKLDVNVTGIVIELQLKEVRGVPMC